MPPAPDVTAEEWTNMAQAATQPGIHHRTGFRERFTSVAQNLRDRKILGRPLYEVVADIGAGYVVKTAIKSGVVLAGASTLGAFGAAVAAGAVSGAVFAGGKEWVRQARENWQQPLPPEAVTTKQQILERLKDLKPNDWKKLGKVTLRGAVIGAAGGLIGATVADLIHGVNPLSGVPNGDHVTSTATPVADHFAPQPETTFTTPGDHIGSATPAVEPPQTPSIPTGTVTTSVPETHLPGPDTTPSHFAESSTTPSTDHFAPQPEATTTSTPSGDHLESGTPTAEASPMHTPNAVHSGEVPSATAEPSATPSPDHLAPQPDTTPVPSAEPPPLPSGPGVTPPFESPPSIVPPIDTLTDHIQNLKDVPLTAGSNPWEVATELLKQVNPDTVPSNAEIMEVTRAICEQNNISVPEWDISGTIDEHKIPIGYLLRIDPEVKSVIASVVKGGK